MKFWEWVGEHPILFCVLVVLLDGLLLDLAHALRGCGQ